MALGLDTASRRLVALLCLALGAATCLGVAGPAFGAVAVGSYCVVGTGPTAGAATDGWVAVLTPAGAVTLLVNGAPFVNPNDCAIDANGDIVVVDKGIAGAAFDGAVYRVSTVGPTVTTVVSPVGSPMQNPSGLAVGSDGNYYVADTGAVFGQASADGAIFKVTPAGVVTTLAKGAPLDDPSDVDIDPRPFAAPSAGANLIITDAEGGVANRSALRRVPTAGGAVQTIANGIGSNFNKLEVGPFGNYFIVNAGANSVLRYDRGTGARTTIQTGAPLVTALGITVDYLTADLVIADSGAGVVNVPPNAPLAAPAVVAAVGAFPANLSGIGFSPPLASTNPSTNWGVPTRRAPIPGGTPEITGTTVTSVNGDMEHEADFFIEVTSTANPLMVRIFDADTSNGYDFNFGGAFDTSVTYTLFDPAGATVSSVVVGAGARTDLDQRIATLNSGNTLTIRGGGINLVAGRTGLYRLQVLATNGSDVNAFGVWIDGFHTYTFNTIFGPLTTDGGPPTVTNLDPSRVYPYFDRGCEYTSSAFDDDTASWPGISGTITTRLGQAIALTLSPNNEHLETLIAPTPGGSALSNIETDYGIHTLSSTLSPVGNENNLVTWRAADFQGWVDGGTTAPPIPVPPGNPAANPTPTLRTSPGPAFPQTPFGAATNTFIRHYLPRYDETPTTAAAPYAPYAMQSATPLAGDPPVVGVPAYYAVLVTVVNPDPVNAMTNVALTAPVPAPAQYVTAGTNVNGPARATGGGVVGTCGAPCSGNITSTWASIPANSAVTLSYAVKVTAAAVGQRLYLTGGPAVRGGGKNPAANAAPTPGTTATFTPAWSSATFTRAESLGPLCDLSSLQGAVSPVAVSLSRFEAVAGDAEAAVVWDTASEFDNLGFEVWRRLAGESDFRRVSPGIILGHGTTDLAAHYAFKDAPLTNGIKAEYLLEDIELDGRTMWHGPVDATPEASLPSLPLDPAEFAPILAVSPASETPLAVAGTGVGTAGGSAGSTATAPSSVSANGALAAPPLDYGSFQVVESDGGGVLLDIRLPPVTLGSVMVGGKDYTQVLASGFDATLAPGFPQLPSRTFWVEVPDRTRFEAHVLERDGGTQTLSAPVVPVAGTAISGSTVTPSRPTPNPAAYASRSPYPAAAVEVAGSVATESGGRLLAVRVNPARFTASTESLDVDSHLRVRVDALGPEPLAAAGAAPSAVAANIEALAASPGIKIGVRGVGLVRVDEASLIAAGLDPASDPRELHLYHDGIEVAIEVDGEATGRLDPSGALFFHSEGLDTRYSDEAVYFLLPANTLGRRTAHLAELPSAGPEVLDIPAHAHDAVKSTYLPGVTTNGGDHFVGPYVFDQPVTRSVPTPGATAAAASLRVRLRGGTTYPDILLDHHFGVRVGGVDVLDVRFDGTDEFDETVVLPAGLVVDGQTQVEIVPRFDSGAPFDLIYLDALDIDYRRDTQLRTADLGRLEIPLDTTGVVALGGLVSPDVRVWDVSDPTTPAAIVGVWVGSDSFTFEGTAGHRYEAATSTGLLLASSLRHNVPSSWLAGGAADWLAIAPASLIPQLKPLAARREAQGLRTAIVDVEDVYDEITGGEFTPVAIRDFVRRIAKSWRPAPRYLLLVGSATYDYRNYLQGTGINLVPTMLVDTTFVEAADDAYFGTLDDAHLAPDLFVGRIPARTPSELEAIVDKLLKYELDASGRAALDEPWRSRALLVADNGPGSGNPAEAAEFEGALTRVAGELPPDIASTSVVLSELPDANRGPLANAAIESALTGGVGLAIYAGHGGAQLWSDKLIFGPADVSAVPDGSTLPVFLVLGCLNAFFDAPNEDSLGQIALSASDRGAVAFVASTTVTAFAGDDVFARNLAERIFGANVRRLGEAVTQAKQAMATSPGAEDVLRTFVLLGDPATRLGIPKFPIANPGPSQKANAWTPVVLDGSQSSAPSGGGLTYAWQIVTEPTAGNGVLVHEETAHPTFLTGTPGTYTLELTVSDGHRRSAPATVAVDISPGVSPFGCAKSPSGPGTQFTSVDALYLLLPLLAARTVRRTRRGFVARARRSPSL
ncbi:MAG TPA: C25 family cysteine peptidase [Myxococcota bacterium]|nr:C25 family cysteine peptidase [Myxococcota bacterium]